MHHCARRVLVVLATTGLWAAMCLAQATQGAPAEQPEGPEFVPVRTDKSGAQPATPGAGAPESDRPAAGDANAGGPGRGGPARDQQSPLGGMWFYVILLGGFVLLYVWMGRSRRKQEAKRREMLSTLKKNDKIVTIGGVIGTVIETKADEVTVKVDETNNVRMKFARWAIRGVGEEAKDQAQEDKK